MDLENLFIGYSSTIIRFQTLKTLWIVKKLVPDYKTLVNAELSGAEKYRILVKEWAMSTG